MVETRTGPFKDPTNLTNWTKWSLFAQIAISLIALVGGALEFQLLREIRLAASGSGRDLTSAAEANDLLMALIGAVQVLVFVTSGVLILMWIYRVNFNAHRLGASDMTYTPGWAVGWYFIPLANLWVPYRAMKEIWQASANPQQWENEDRPWLLPVWWALWIISSVVGNGAFRLALRDEPTLDDLLVLNGVTFVSDALAIPLAVVFLVIVQKIHRMQIHQAQLQSFA